MATEAVRCQGPRQAHLLRGGGHLALSVQRGCAWLRACVGGCVSARVLGPRARVCPACARAWRRARDLAALVRARRSARPPAGAQHRLRPGVCMRGVSERVGGRAGWAAESSRGAPPFSGRPGTGPAPRSPRRGKARRQLGPPGVPLPNSWPRPGGLQARRGGGRREGPAAAGPCPACSLSGSGRGGAAAEGRGPQGGRPAALEEPQEQKETATAPPWSKQPALAAAQGRAAASEPSALTPSLLPPPPPPPLPYAWLRATGLVSPAAD